MSGLRKKFLSYSQTLQMAAPNGQAELLLSGTEDSSISQFYHLLGPHLQVGEEVKNEVSGPPQKHKG